MHVSSERRDYLYPAAHFATTAGPHFQKRNLVKQLLTRQLVTAEPYAPECMADHCPFSRSGCRGQAARAAA